jgi:hypothetical protein
VTARVASGLLTLLACAVASISYIGVITGDALAMFLLPTVSIVGLVAIRQRGRTLLGIALVTLLAGGGGEIVNLLSGEYEGPAARSTSLAALGTGLAVVLSGSRAPAAFLLPLVGVVAGANAFGAGGHVQVVAVATGCFASLALAAIERERRAVAGPQRRVAPVLVALMLVAGVGVFAALFQGEHDAHTAKAPLRQALTVPVKPPKLLGLPSQVLRPPAPAVNVTQDPSSSSQPTTRGRLTRVAEVWLLVLLSAGMALLGALLLRVLVASWTWRRHYRRLSGGRPATAAWTSAMAHLSRLEMAPQPSSSPDVIACGRLRGIPDGLTRPVQELASLVAPLIFGGAVATKKAERDAWLLATEIAEQAWNDASSLERLKARWRMAPAPRGINAARFTRVLPHG